LRVDNSKIVRASTGFKLAHMTSIGLKAYLVKVGSGDLVSQTQGLSFYTSESGPLGSDHLLIQGSGSKTQLKYGRHSSQWTIILSCRHAHLMGVDKYKCEG